MIRLDTPRNSTSWGIGLAKTFRNTSSSLHNGTGTNLQNPSKAICRIYIPDTGKCFVQVDQSGAEALIVAYLCRHGAFRDLFLHGVKPHVFVALHVFRKQFELLTGRDLGVYINASPATLTSQPNWKEIDKLIKSSDNWEPSKRYYFIAKMICHASNYGMKAGAFQMHVLQKSEGKVALDKFTCETALFKYHDLFKEIHEWHRETRYILERDRVLRNLFGHPREFYEVTSAKVDDEEILKDAYSFVPQSTVGCITHIAFARMQDYIDANKLDWDILNNKHDSILVQCPTEAREQAALTLKNFIEQDLVSLRGEPFRMKSEAQWGFNWKPQHEQYNPDGLREFGKN